ncbi:MAG TPA: hypothetical protein VFT03_00365, partial [Rubrobacteraceae bacterium]|nr:hypothetical protein [Rubrobacteraceae bacterium]
MYVDFTIRWNVFSFVPHPLSYIFRVLVGLLSSRIAREKDMILKEFSRILVEELDARRLASGDASRPVRGLAVEELAVGWLEKDEVAITSRETLDEGFLKSAAEAGAPAI